MTLSYLALALAVVLMLAGIAGTAFTFRAIAQRQAQRPHDINTRTWDSIIAPAHALRLYFGIAADAEVGDARLSRLLYRSGLIVAVGVAAVGHYLIVSVAAIERMAIALLQYLK